MKRLTPRVAIALLTFVVGVLAVWPLSQYRRLPEPLNVDFCRLVNSPDNYGRKVVRTEAILYFSDRENGVLYHERCASGVACADIAFDVVAYDEAHSSLEAAYRYGDSQHSRRARVMLVGKFFRGHDRGYTPDDGCLYGFDISRIEHAEPVPDDVPWR